MEIRTRQPRHLHVSDQAIDAAPAVEIQEILGAVEGDGLITERSEETFYGLTHRLVVIDNRDKKFALQRRFLIGRTNNGEPPPPRQTFI